MSRPADPRDGRPRDLVADLRSPQGQRLRLAAAEALAAATAAAAAGRGRADPLAIATALRGGHPDADADLVRAALEQAALAAAARDRLGPVVDGLLLTREGVEQATRAVVADRRAARLAASGARCVADLGCGLGFDALAMLAAGVSVRAIERDPLTAALAEANLASAAGTSIVTDPSNTTSPRPRRRDDPVTGPRRRGPDDPRGGWRADPVATVRCADVTDDQALAWALTGADTAFVDPARRDPHGARDAAGGRAVQERDPRHWSPPWPWVVALADRRPRTVAKVAPGIPRDLAPADAETAWVSVDGTLVEAVVWFAGLADPTVRRRAVVLRTGHPDADLTSPQPYAPDRPPHAAAGSVGEWLVEPDDAVTRAGLVTDLADLVAGWLVHPRLALVTTAARPDTPLGRVWRVLDVLPDDTRSLRAALRARGVTSVTVKTRGVSATPEAVRRALRLGGGRDESREGRPRGDGDHATVLLTRTPAGGRALLLAAADRDM